MDNVNDNKNNVIKISKFSIAKPESLISIKYNNKNEDINIINNGSKNQEINKETNIDNNIKNNENGNENGNNDVKNNNSDDKVIYIDNNNNDDDKVIYVDNNNLNGKKSDNKSVKKSRKFLCCL